MVDVLLVKALIYFRKSYKTLYRTEKNQFPLKQYKRKLRVDVILEAFLTQVLLPSTICLSIRL